MARMMERQESLGLHLKEGVAVIGCGGVGSWTAYLLALAGVERLFLFDKDVISDHNLNRIPLPIDTVGQYKSFAIADMINKIRPDCKIVPFGVFSPDTADLLELQKDIGWIVAATDTLSSRLMVAKWAKENDIQYIEAAAEGDQGSATGVPAEFFTPEENQPGYASVPVWAGPCVSSAVIAVSHVVHNIPMGDRVIRMGVEKEVTAMSKMFTVFDSEKGK